MTLPAAIPAPTLPLAAFTMGLYRPVQVVGRRRVADGPGFHQGTARWATAHPDDATHMARERDLARFHGLATGRADQPVTIPLAPWYLHADAPPVAMSATVSSSSISAMSGLLVASVAVTGAGAWRPTSGPYVSASDPERVYQIQSVTVNSATSWDLTLAPAVEIEAGASLEFAAPVVRAFLDAPGPLGRAGQSLIQYVYGWAEVEEE